MSRLADYVGVRPYVALAECFRDAFTATSYHDPI